MASQAFAGVGTKFQRWSGSVWEDIAEVNAIEGPGMTKDVLEVTSLDTDAGYNEFITGFAEGGTLTLDMNFTRETYELMKEDFESDEVRSYRIQLPDYDSEPSTFTIEGLVIELPITMTADDKVTADVVIQITSQVVLDVGSTVPAEEEDSWSSYWATRSLFFLDGTILDVAGTKYFVDKSTNGRNFLITGYDFDASWTLGFPYKSAATISAPADDVALIAADINNFLYADDGTPNQIPVISLFQNIDYENTIYCKHEAQVLDANGVETYEPRVSQIFMTAAALSASDLVKANTYFGVPIEQAYNWVTKVGQDAAARGTKAAPWLTTQYAENNCDVDANIYIKSGAYGEYDSSYNYIFYNKKVNFHAIGRMKLDNSHVSYLGYLLRIYNQGDTSIERYIINSDNTYTGAVLSMEGTNESIEKCYISGKDTLVGLNAVSVINIKNSVLIPRGSDKLLYFYQNGTLNFEGNHIVNTTTKYVINTATGTVVLNVKNNKFTGTWPTSCIRVASPGNKNIIGNTVIQTNAGNGNFILGDAAVAQALVVRGNKIYVNTAPTAANQILIETILTSITIDYNKIVIAAVTKASLDPIRIKNNAACAINSNIIDSSLDGTLHGIILSSTGTNIDNGTVSNNVSIIRAGTAGYHIIVGADGADTAENHCNNCVISENVIYSQNYFNASPAALTTHAIEYGYSKGLITRNLVLGTGVGCIAKWENADGSDLTYNILIDTIWSLYLKGSNGSKIYNNFVRNSVLSSFAGVYVIVNVTQAPLNVVIKNNILINDIDNANNWLMNINIASIETLTSDYNVFYTARADGKIIRTSDDATYTLAEWQALGFDAHSVLLTDEQLAVQFPTGQYYPTTPITGEALDAAYDDGLDLTTDWGNLTAVPSVVTKQQAATWQIGAYIV